jgi:hypothetical protein
MDKQDFIKMTESRQTGDTFEVPSWLSRLALMSVVATKPIGYCSFLAIQIIAIIVISSQEAPLSEHLILPAIFFMFGFCLLGWMLYLFIISSMMARNMQAEGTLKGILSVLFSDHKIPRFFLKVFTR